MRETKCQHPRKQETSTQGAIKEHGRHDCPGPPAIDIYERTDIRTYEESTESLAGKSMRRVVEVHRLSWHTDDMFIEIFI